MTELSQESQLSRKTFYRLFNNKDDVLSYLFEQLYIKCLEELRSRNANHYWDVVQCYFDFWEKRKNTLSVFSKNGLLPALFDGAYKYSFSVFMQVRSKDVSQEYSVPLPYLLAYSIGGIHSMLMKWAENEMEIPSCQLIETLRKAFSSSEI